MPRRAQPLWVSRLVLDAVHFDLLRAHGGMPGLRDENALESALARPRHRWVYGRRVDLAALAAAYGYGLVRSHPYRDGNKRIAFLAMAVFVGLNGHEIDASEPEVVTLMLTLAAGRMREAALARWLRAHLVASRGPDSD
jgi:death-on-curing protein